MKRFASLLRQSLKRLLSGRTVVIPAARNASLLFLNYESALGAAALATATFAAVKSARPDLRIVVAASGLPSELFRSSPYIDELIQTPHGVKHFWSALACFLRVIRRRCDFSYVITDISQARRKIAFLALSSGARFRIGLSPTPELFHVALKQDKRRSNLDNNLDIVRALGLDVITAEPAIHFTSDDLAKVEAILAEVPAVVGPRIAVIANSSKGHPNEWFDDRWTELIRRLQHRLDAQIIFVGAKGDAPQIERIREAAGVPTFSAAGRTDLPQLAALLALCDLVVTIDTGGLHVARAVNAPAVVLANAAQPDNWWLPPKTDPRFRILRHGDVPCALCLKFACATRECMQESTVDMVEQAVIDHLAAFPASVEARAKRAAARTNDRTPILTCP